MKFVALTVTVEVSTIVPRIVGKALYPFAVMGFMWPARVLTYVAERTTFYRLDGGRWRRMKPSILREVPA